jgi:hypothetical protein
LRFAGPRLRAARAGDRADFRPRRIAGRAVFFMRDVWIRDRVRVERVRVLFRGFRFDFDFAFALGFGRARRFGFARAVAFGIASARAISRALAASNSGATRSASQRSNSTSSG